MCYHTEFFESLQRILKFREGEIETIDLPSSAFDAALCRFGLMFLPTFKQVYLISTIL